MSREKTIAHFKNNPELSVLIIGGGINGIGTFRDLALQGVDVLLVERGDFCSGASAASSHMAHGGIRYLENGEFRLVREAVQERNRLINNAPHYVKPLPTTIPIFTHFSGLLNAPLKFLNLLDRPAERGALVIKLGLMMYDVYTGKQRTVSRHTFTGRQRSLQQFPKLNSTIRYTATYYDGAILNPERLALEVLLDGEDAHGQAHALNYALAIGAQGRRVTLRDEVTGETFIVQPQLVINAAGPWIDWVNASLGQKTHFIGGTKGSHIILDHPELYSACAGHELFFENKDGRIVLIYPFHTRVMIGTSDIRVDNPDEAVCTDEEIDYFLDFVRFIFPDIAIDRSQIVYKFCGVRPLPASEAGTTGQISRDHRNTILEAGNGLNFPIFNLIGGKWTTFRAFAEQVTDEALRYLQCERKAGTANQPIGGGRDYPADATARQAWIGRVADETGLSTRRVEQLLERYGTRAAPMAQFISAGDDHPLSHKPNYSTFEIIFLVEREKVIHLTDILQRRTLLAMLGELTPELIVEIGHMVGPILGWTSEEIEREIAHSLPLLL